MNIQQNTVSENNFEQCIKCTICTVYCPVAAVNPDYPGPKQAGPDGERLRLKQPDFFDSALKYCLNCKRCEVACPSNVRIGDIIQAARIKYGPKHNTSIRNYILANTDLVGTLATPLAPVVNAAVATKPVRMIMDKVMGIDHRRIFPKYSHGTFESWYRRHAAEQQASFERQVSYFHGCYVNYNNPQLGKDMIRIMNALGYGVRLLDKEKCCGVALISNGLYSQAKRQARTNMESIRTAVKGDGRDVITTSSTCTFTLRDDASSRFSKDTRWGLFPSGAFAWNIAEENFLKDSRAVSALKLRVGVGQTGQQEIGSNYPYLARYYMSTDVYKTYYMGSAGHMFYLTPGAYDPNIKWETTTTYNVGLDFGFLGGRINGSVDWYLRQTDDLLNSVITPMGSNFGNTVLTNIGSMENKGVEFNLNFIPVQTKDWNLTVGFNGTFQHTEFTKLNNTDDPDYNIQTGSITKGTGNLLQIHKVGYAPYTFYCFQQVYDQDGNPIQNALVDRDKDGKITQADRYVTDKSPNPDFFYGISLKLSYKNWDFGFNGHGSAGNWVFNDFASANSTSNIDINAGNLPNFARLVKKTGFTKANSGEQWYSDMFLENASFFRMDDINLGYTFNKIGNWKGSMRVAFGVQNVFVITDYSGVDPEIPGVNGIDGSIWPRPRTYSLRLNVNF